MWNADIGTRVNSAPDQLRAGLIIACHWKTGGQTIGQNMPQPVTVISLAMAMQFSGKDGYEIIAVMVLHVDDGLAAILFVGPVMFGQAGEVIPGLSIKLDHLFRAVAAIGKCGMPVQVAAIIAAFGKDQDSCHTNIFRTNLIGVCCYQPILLTQIVATTLHHQICRISESRLIVRTK